MIVEVGGGPDEATLAVTDDTTDGEVVDGKTALEDSMLADRLLLVRRVVPESRSIMQKSRKANDQGETLEQERKLQSLRANVLTK